MRIQCYISECEPEALAEFTENLQPHISVLIVHKFGSFILQRLLASFGPSFEMVEGLCKANFQELIKNEYSSRVIQLLIEKSNEFCDFTLEFFRENLVQATTLSSACHLLVAALKNTTSVHSRDFIIDHLRKKPVLIGNRFFQRVLLTYVHIGTQKQLDEVAAVLGISSKLSRLFNRKATNVIVLTLLKREHKPTTHAVCIQLSRNPQQLFETRYFTTSMHKLTEDKLTSLMNSVFDTLVSLQSHVLEPLGKKRETVCQLIYLMLSCCCEHKKP